MPKPKATLNFPRQKRSPRFEKMLEGNVKHDGRREVERLIRILSPAEQVIWRSLGGYVPIGFRRVFAETVRRAAWDEQGMNRPSVCRVSRESANAGIDDRTHNPTPARYSLEPARADPRRRR